MLVPTASRWPWVPLGTIVASAVDPGVATTLASSTEFLYSGADPVQTGVAPGTIGPVQVAVLRGKVSDSSGAPLSGVIITVLNHPEFGQTLSRTDGMFDLAVNGGGPLTVNYAKEGFLPVQRQLDVPWQDYTFLPDIVLIQVDSQVTTVDLSAAVPVQVAQGNVVTDDDGTRQATLLFPQGTTAEMVMPDGSTQPISTLNVRATEYTVGENGPQAMPAELPPTSGYTYAVEFTVDEAMAAGATDVRFDQPLSFYLENFLDFPVGGIVPVGFYDRQQGQWIPSENGLIIEVVAITGGLADLDLDGDGLADDAAALAALGITDAEREELATLYTPGQSLWRVPITHFTPWDCNWPQGPGPNDRPPNQPRPRGGIDDNRPDDDCLGPAGSVIGCQNQTLGESIPVNGTPFAPNYISDSVPGRKDAYTLEIPLSGDDMPASARRIELEIFVAGQNLTQIFPALPNQTHTFTWDGLDAYGRTVHGAQPVTVRIGYVYGLVYLQPSAFGEAFARFSSSSGGEGVGGSVIVGNQARQEVTNWQDWKVSIGTRDVRGLGLGAWTLSMHHVYDPLGRVLYRGDGRQRSASQLERILVTVAGTGEFGGCLTTLYPSGCSGDDGGPATQAQLANPDGVAISPDGTLYIAESSGNGNRIRRVDPEGNITTLAGTGADCRPPTDPCGDGGPATDAKLYFPYAVAVHPDGSIYIADNGSKRIRRVGPEGNITTVAGTGGDCHPLTDPCGDGGPANQAPLGTPIAVAVHPDGSIYIAAGRRIRRVGPDGIITTVAGNGGGCNSGDSCGDGGPATAAEVNAVGLALGPDGALFIADFFPSSRIRRVGPDGSISTVAGGGLAVGDGGPATAAKIKRPIRVAVGPDGSIYIADWGSHRIRLVRPDGIITTVARTAGTGGSSGGGAATGAQLLRPTGLTVGPDGSLYVADEQNQRIRRVGPPLPGFSAGEITIVSEDGSELYRFDGQGQHLRTLHALTGATLFSFSYDSEGRLTTVTDGDGNVTSIERDGGGTLTGIVAPFVQRTQLALDANGYLASITNPAGDIHALTYNGDGGLPATFTDPRGNLSQMTYDGLGRLTRDEDSAGGFFDLARTELAGVRGGPDQRGGPNHHLPGGAPLQWRDTPAAHGPHRRPG